MSAPQVVAEPLGGTSLAREAIRGRGSIWYPDRPSSAEAWNERMAAVRATVPSSWLESLLPAFGAHGLAADRLARAAAGGVVVTTGQQPGLFGGPVYTLSKALSALALADELERQTGVPVAPVFWAATDDADFLEASAVWVNSGSAGGTRAALHQLPTEGIPLAEVAIDGIGPARDALLEAAGSAPHLDVLARVQEAWRDGTPIGTAYLALLRQVLEPLGVAVIDASDAALLRAERPWLLRALERGDVVRDALARCDERLTAAGLEGQVARLDALTLVFRRDGKRKVRVALGDAGAVAGSGATLSPNVLLRPIVERQVLPTVAYVAGPGELAYFAQVQAVTHALDCPGPLAVPRWSCTVVEPVVARAERQLAVAWRSLSDPASAERAVARSAVPADVLQALEAMRAGAREGGRAVREQLAGSGLMVDPRVTDGTVRGMTWRVDRLERRVLAAAKRREADAMRLIAAARASVFPGGKRQERALSFVLLLARYGTGLIEAMRASARRHAEALVEGRELPVDG